jgi:hypothetical protein
MPKEEQMNRTKPTEKRAAKGEGGNLQDMRRFHDAFEIRQPVAGKSASASIPQPVAGEFDPICWRKILHEPGRADLSTLRSGSATEDGPVSLAARQRRPTGFTVPMPIPESWRPSMNRPKYRKVLDCASPLALWMDAALRKRWRATAVQDATAPTRGLYGSKRESFRGILSPERRGRKFKP